MVPDHGFARLGTMQVQAIMPPLMKVRCRVLAANSQRKSCELSAANKFACDCEWLGE